MTLTVSSGNQLLKMVTCVWSMLILLMLLVMFKHLKVKGDSLYQLPIAPMLPSLTDKDMFTFTENQNLFPKVVNFEIGKVDKMFKKWQSNRYQHLIMIQKILLWEPSRLVKRFL